MVQEPKPETQPPTRFDGYWVSSQGRVRERTGIVLKPYIDPRGYATVSAAKRTPETCTCSDRAKRARNTPTRC